MNYTIIIREPVVPQYITVNEATGTASRLNPGTLPTYPATLGRRIYADLSGIYGADPTRRVELYEDPAGTAESAAIFAACPEIRAWKERQIRSEGARRLAQLADPYEPPERETWPYQKAEAEAWAADNSKATPFCDLIAAGRGIPRELFLPKVLENSTLFAMASAQILGQQQALVDQLHGEQDFATFWGLSWPT